MIRYGLLVLFTALFLGLWLGLTVIGWHTVDQFAAAWTLWGPAINLDEYTAAMRLRVISIAVPALACGLPGLICFALLRRTARRFGISGRGD